MKENTSRSRLYLVPRETASAEIAEDWPTDIES